jgi:hypothetical protein
MFDLSSKINIMHHKLEKEGGCMFGGNRLEMSAYMSILKEVCGACDDLARLRLDDPQAIDAFLNHYTLKRENVLTLFTRALALDYLALRTRQARFVEMATLAYTQAITAHERIPDWFRKCQQYYAAIRQEMSNEYKVNLYRFLEPIARLSPFEPFDSSKLPSPEQVLSAIQSLPANLHHLDGEYVKEKARELVEETAKFLAARAGSAAPTILELAPLRHYVWHLYLVISSKNDFVSIEHITSRFSGMTFSETEYNPAQGRRMSHPWLIHDLLVAENVTGFIHALIRTLPAVPAVVVAGGQKRPSADPTAMVEDPREDDEETIYQRRIVRARRAQALLPVPRPAPAPAPDEIPKPDDSEEEKEVEQDAKRGRFTSLR